MNVWLVWGYDVVPTGRSYNTARFYHERVPLHAKYHMIPVFDIFIFDDTGTSGILLNYMLVSSQEKAYFKYLYIYCLS